MIYLKLLLFLSLVMPTQDIGERFVDRLLGDFRDNSYVLVVGVKTNTYTGRVIIKNDDLFQLLSQSKGFDEIRYKVFVKHLLISKGQLSITESDLEKWNVMKTRSLKSVDNIASRGQEAFVRHYFNGRVLKDGIPDNEKAAIIAKLFEWKIATNVDDETGYLVFTKFARQDR
jgi:hypothetical protein